MSAKYTIENFVYEIEELLGGSSVHLVPKWKRILRRVSPDSELLPDELRVRLLWMVTQAKWRKIPPNVLLYLEMRCQWLSNKLLLQKVFPYNSVLNFLARLEMEAEKTNETKLCADDSIKVKQSPKFSPISIVVAKSVQEEVTGKGCLIALFKILTLWYH